MTQTQPDQQAAPVAKKEKPAVTKEKTEPAEEPAANIAGATESKEPLVPLWALFLLSAVVAASAVRLRQANAFWQL